VLILIGSALLIVFEPGSLAKRGDISGFRYLTVDSHTILHITEFHLFQKETLYTLNILLASRLHLCRMLTEMLPSLMVPPRCMLMLLGVHLPPPVRVLLPPCRRGAPPNARARKFPLNRLPAAVTSFNRFLQPSGN
jgi:hypothetical protein